MLLRAKYFGKSDMSIGFNLQRAEEVITSFDPSSAKEDINDILEYYNIIQFFDNKLYLLRWDEATISAYTATVKQLKGAVGRFLHSVQGDDLIGLYEKTDGRLKEDFISVLAKYKVTDRITDEQFTRFINGQPHVMGFVLREKKLVRKYGQVIATLLSTTVEYAELVIDHYFVKHDNQDHTTYMPDELRRDQQEQIVRNYVAWENASVNYLKIVSGLKKAGDYPIDDKVRLQAHRRVRSYWAKHFEDGKGSMSFGVEIKLVEQEAPVLSTYDGTENKECLSYSKQWIAENRDFPTLWNNFIYLFRFVDLHYRCQFFSNPTYMGIIERMMGVHANNEYATGVGFEGVKTRSILQMFAYQKELRNYGLEIEGLFKWFFEEYLKNEFEVEGYRYSAPSSQASVLERILLIASQLDAVLKQFRLYIDDGLIDRELFEFSSSPYRIVDTPSMVEKKYLYPVGDTIKQALYYLFSDQCPLSYTEKTGEKYNCFSELLIKAEVEVSDYPEYAHNDLRWLIEKGIILTDNKGFLRIKKPVYNLLFDLYYNGNIAYSYCDENERILVNKLLESGELVAESRLFTRQEQEYLDYMLNVQQFFNGPELRNKYVHGNSSLDPKIQERDYFELLKIMTLIVLKINEEFCLKYPSENGSMVVIV